MSLYHPYTTNNTAVAIDTAFSNNTAIDIDKTLSFNLYQKHPNFFQELPIKLMAKLQQPRALNTKAILARISTADNGDKDNKGQSELRLQVEQKFYQINNKPDANRSGYAILTNQDEIIMASYLVPANANSQTKACLHELVTKASEWSAQQANANAAVRQSWKQIKGNLSKYKFNKNFMTINITPIITASSELDNNETIILKAINKFILENYRGSALYQLWNNSIDTQNTFDHTLKKNQAIYHVDQSDLQTWSNDPGHSDFATLIINLNNAFAKAKKIIDQALLDIKQEPDILLSQIGENFNHNAILKVLDKLKIDKLISLSYNPTDLIYNNKHIIRFLKTCNNQAKQQFAKYLYHLRRKPKPMNSTIIQEKLDNDYTA